MRMKNTRALLVSAPDLESKGSEFVAFSLAVASNKRKNQEEKNGLG